MTGVSEKVPEFDLPVCRSFTKTVIDGQLCYELEVDKFFAGHKKYQQLVKGLTFVLDYNEDRNLVRFREAEKTREVNIVDNIVNFEESNEALIYIKSISRPTSNDSLIAVRSQIGWIEDIFNSFNLINLI